MEQTLGISLEEKSRNSYSEMPYQESCTYASPEKAGKEQIEIFSDKEDRRVNSCEVVLSKEEMELFFQEIFSQIIPETYLTEEEIERTFDRTQDGFYRFDAHGKFSDDIVEEEKLGEIRKRAGMVSFKPYCLWPENRRMKRKQREAMQEIPKNTGNSWIL